MKGPGGAHETRRGTELRLLIKKDSATFPVWSVPPQAKHEHTTQTEPTSLGFGNIKLWTGRIRNPMAATVRTKRARCALYQIAWIVKSELLSGLDPGGRECLAKKWVEEEQRLGLMTRDTGWEAEGAPWGEMIIPNHISSRMMELGAEGEKMDEHDGTLPIQISVTVVLLRSVLHYSPHLSLSPLTTVYTEVPVYLNRLTAGGPHVGDHVGQSVRLQPVPIQSLSELERARLQEVALYHLEERDLDIKISIPRGTGLKLMD
ncbi:hypothetical protein INR49_002471 [Caranx melampygus]|nr:hypothetical protein INR49_002471 [Caranx melampygus]